MSGAPDPTREATVDEALALKLTRHEYERAVDALGRPPNVTELAVLSVLWSEHCAYKSSKVYLGGLPTSGPRVLYGPGENAGVVDLGDGWAAVLKIESHNHPSFIEPYQGAATGVGGILRDIFTMGARPVALLNALHMGDASRAATANTLRGVVAGIAGYGNAVGVATVGGELSFDPAFDTNPLVNVLAVGVVRHDKLVLGRARGPGNRLIYLGARTGRDGIHGATMASDSFDARQRAARPTVQVGDPFTAKCLIEACLEIFDAGLAVGAQDMGAAGLSSSTVELASRARTGVTLWLDAVPRRALGMSAQEMLLSESQERMLLVARPEDEAAIGAIAARWELAFAVVGEVTDTQEFVVTHTASFEPRDGATRPEAPAVVCALPVSLLTDAAPTYWRPCDAHARREDLWGVDIEALAFEPQTDLVALIGSPELGSRQALWRQFDARVRNGTVVMPGAADAAVLRVFCEDRGARYEKRLALSADSNARVGALDPRLGAALAVAEACRNVACVGARPIAITNCLNYASPIRPAAMTQLRDGIAGLAEACAALGVPVVSGNVSLSNETTLAQGLRAVLPTATVGALGQHRQPSDLVAMGFRTPGDAVFLLGPNDDPRLGGSAWLTRKLGRLGGEPPGLDLAREAALHRVLLAAAERGLLRSAHDVASGGLLVCLAEACIAEGVGLTARLPGSPSAPGLCFGEAPSRAVVSVAPAVEGLVRALADAEGVPMTRLGVAGGARLVVEGLVDLDLDALAAAHHRCLDALFEPPGAPDNRPETSNNQ